MTPQIVKILIVDDSADNLTSMEALLEKDGYAFSKALSGKEALKILLKEDDFSLILLDVRMPIMDGYETAELIFDNVRLPEENLIGEVGMGFIQAMQILDGGRISIAALSCGIARGAYEASVKYAKEREQFGKPIAGFQLQQKKLAEMITEITKDPQSFYVSGTKR